MSHLAYYYDKSTTLIRRDRYPDHSTPSAGGANEPQTDFLPARLHRSLHNSLGKNHLPAARQPAWALQLRRAVGPLIPRIDGSRGGTRSEDRVGYSGRGSLSSIARRPCISSL